MNMKFFAAAAAAAALLNPHLAQHCLFSPLDCVGHLA